MAGRKKQLKQVTIYAVQTYKKGGCALIYQAIAENYEIALIEKRCQQNVFTDCHTTIEKYTIRLDKLVKECNI